MLFRSRRSAGARSQSHAGARHPHAAAADLLSPDTRRRTRRTRVGQVRGVVRTARAAARADQGRDNSNKTAVVAVGSFVGHRGHEQLWELTKNKAAELNADPYLFIGTAEGKDDPIPPAVKVQTWHRLDPQYSKNISTVTQEGGSLLQKIKHELINPLPGKTPRYDTIYISVGKDRAAMATQMASALMKAVNKFQNYENVKVIPWVTERDEATGGTGISFTALRTALKTGTPEEQLAKWEKGFDVQKLGADWIRHLMDVARQHMGLNKTMPQQPKPVNEVRLLNSLIRPQLMIQEEQGVAEGSLSEIDRRGFLKGLGAAAVAGAAGYKLGQGSVPPGKEKYFNPRLWYLCGYLDTRHLPGKWEKETADSILSEVNGILRRL